MHERHLARLLIGGLSACLACAAVAQSVSGTPSTASEGDISFMKHAAIDGVAEVKLGQLALDKSSNADVKKLAQRMVDDHTRANDDLQTLAQGKQVTLPSPPTDADPTTSALKDEDGAKFDQVWTDMLVKNHQKAVELFTAEKRQAQDPDVRNFAEKTLPVLNTHLEMARALQDQLALSDSRDSAMGKHTPVGESAFDHVSNPATATTAASAPASATSMGIH